MSTQVIGTPASYAARQARANGARALRCAALTAAAGAAAAALVIVALLRGPGHFSGAPLVAAAVLGIVAVAAHRKGGTYRATRQRQVRGVRAEQEVVQALRSCGAALVINGAELHAGGDADHVVATLGRAGTGTLAVVETKAGGGHVRLQSGRLLSGRNARQIPGDPIAQCRRQADALARLTGRAVLPIVCVTGMTSDPFTASGAVVCGTRHLGGVLSRATTVNLTEADVASLATRVQPKP